MFDVVIIGAGVGLSILKESLAEKTSLTALIIEKEESYGEKHQAETVKLFILGYIIEKFFEAKTLP